MRNARPKNLNLLTIRLPINAVVSILHRLSGVALYLVLPIGLWLLHLSLSNQAGYDMAVFYLNHWFVKCLLLMISWAFFHHFYAGLRHLAQDLHWMHSMQQAKLSSRVLLALVALSVVALAFLIW